MTEHPQDPHGATLLLAAGALFRGDRPLVAVACLQALPIGRDIGPEILRQSDDFGQPQRVADHDIGRGEAAGASVSALAVAASTARSRPKNHLA